MNQDAFVFAPESDPLEQISPVARPPWIILSVDDEPGVHQVTKLALSGFEFDQRPLQIHTAASGTEAMAFMANNRNVAMMLLDIVMESDDAGLGVARYVRDTLGNNYTRIVLRTGQPGQAPEDQVIRDYDIDGYVEKTDLVQAKLHSLLYSALRAYRDIGTIQQNRRGLEQVINAITSINNTENLSSFASAVLNQLACLAPSCSQAGQDMAPSAYVLAKIENNISILAASYEFSGPLPQQNLTALQPEIRQAMLQALHQQQSSATDDYLISYHRSPRGSECVLYIRGYRHLAPAERKLVRLFSNNVVITYEALLLQEEVKQTQLTLVHTLGEAVESRSKETGAHVRRVGEYAALLAELFGQPPEATSRLRHASPLHDIGKIAIPDHILNKPGPLDADEWTTMKQHSERGYDILKKSDKPLLQLAAVIARQHHEHWDGNGYPQGLEGESIDLAARITAVVDVFDALCCQRCYKDAISPQAALAILREGSGSHLDPTLVALLDSHFEQFLAIRARYPD